ncbi:dolichol-phosphate mannosyltransferase subunit 3-like [Apostichopus japonicus]|uniref:dolichol-phosphate mannosyltransferase subunit 3-like n=1 Tax=Stichopus japonicus TaxID=307972 RepID=UPI003AB56AF5
MATKLVQWLTLFTLFSSVWLSLVLKLIPVELDPRIMDVLWPLPIYLLVVFGSYSLATIGYRVATFNDCDEAAESLKQEIKEAREDLTRKGFKFS